MSGKLGKVNLNNYKPLREVIFSTLREAIIMGELKPGERLMEVQLAEKMGVSRTPVREAIRKLELEGLVVMMPRRGAHVARLTDKDIMDVLEVRASLDGLATALATERIKEDEVKELKHIQAQLENYVEKGNLQGIIKKDIEFHDVIYKASKNEKLVQIANNLREQVYRFRVIYLKDFGSNEEVIREHNEICSAIFNKNPEQAREAAQNHIRSQETTIVSAVKKSKMS
ncbi:MAG: GntR family transcriptional regulator [Clostridiaceae bacterium]|nr:GntR family transcriptional regulator [Clostridiaceae bacterium]